MVQRFTRLSASVLIQVFLIVITFYTLAPLATVWLASFKTNAEITMNPLALPKVWRFQNFVEAWETAHLGRYLANSVYVTVPTMALVLASASLAGYAFGMLRFRGRGFLFALFLIGLMVPNISLIVPLYYTVLDLGLQNTRLGLILSEAAVALPLATFIMRGAFRDLPSELREAVLIDGGNELDSFWRVMFPLARPALSTAAVLVFLGAWNSFLYPLILINSDGLRTLPLGLGFMQGRYVTNTVLLAAAATLAAIPSIAVYIVFQRRFIKGIVEGSFK
ncbi:MAG: carbohydrate ABC transporter permease [Anaerolineae bacterium]|nr:carbohydrate ABC transporter permease [Anaerolineae bacterium]